LKVEHAMKCYVKRTIKVTMNTKRKCLGDDSDLDILPGLRLIMQCDDDVMAPPQPSQMKAIQAMEAHCCL
jgi:hypothetical protein